MKVMLTVPASKTRSVKKWNDYRSWKCSFEMSSYWMFKKASSGTGRLMLVGTDVRKVTKNRHCH